jgi:ABC-2 type transport system ATP-binding protein
VRHVQQVREQHGTSILWATHIVEEVADADRIALIVAGRIIRIGTPAEIMAAAGTDNLTEAYIALTGVKPGADAPALAG